MRKYRCRGVFICGCGFQLGTDIVKVILDASNWLLPSAGGTFQGGGSETIPNNHAVLPYKNLRGGSCLCGVCVCMFMCSHEASSDAG